LEVIFELWREFLVNHLFFGEENHLFLSKFLLNKSGRNGF
jgi:hypothetical protein